MCEFTFLEEQVAIVYYLCVQHQVLHESACSLHVLLHTHLHLLSLVVLNAWAHCLLHYLEYIYTCIALNWLLRELACGCCCHCTRECWLGSTSSLNKGWGSESDLVYFANLGTLGLCCSDAVQTVELRDELFSLLVFDNFALQNFLYFCIVP